ncbi:ThuA domain-containing protein [Mucilaginibacter sp. UR6-1]|uniref:ThuA domain-containing protein n=1 Tax=Mucilaginibacter sp. UR6-1 TaxID=1435643 RepID=UPI001E38F3B3|nr:ThuA domain-containing protein [Mucilaginibacter sp. UR6-1]MCC8407529.1 ThuA domain-containing protein [Mucilaginibacter sp. UR6-1]
MMTKIFRTIRFILVVITLLISTACFAQKTQPAFRVIAFYTAKNDAAHISFVDEANKWFAQVAAQNHFAYDATSDWNKLNAKFLSKYKVVVFLDTRPETKAQRDAFETYMRNGGGWMGFHFSAFALTPSDYPQNWDWYHNEFLGSGSYVSNTWRPTSASIKVEDRNHPVTKGMPVLFRSAPNEWYRWEKDLRQNKDIRILCSIDTCSFPLGTGPKPEEIWHSGYYPVVWTNTRYKMIYFNMGHNDMDYEHGTNQTLSHTFDSTVEDQLIINSLLWLGGKQAAH